MTQKYHFQAYTLKKPKLKKDTYTPMFTAALFTIGKTWKKPRCPWTDEWIKKLWQVCTMEYYSVIKRNAFELVIVRWMNLEPITQSEESQKEESKYCILMPTYGIQKDGTDESVCRAAIEMQRTDLWITVREKRESEINGESSPNAYALTYVNSQW